MQPSSIVVTDRKSLADNFSENSTRFLCDTALGTGSYAVGGQLLGLVKLTPPARLITAGALLAALALCPSSGSDSSLFGQPPPFSGGQCGGTYDIWTQFGPLGGPPNPANVSGSVVGPIAIFEEIFLPSPLGGRQYGVRVMGATDSVPREIGFGFREGQVTKYFVEFRRQGGLIDDCGSLPRGPGQVVTNINNGDTINSSTVVDNRDQKTVIPVSFSLGGISNTLNLEFGNVIIKSLLPLTFNIDIGGSTFGFRENPDGTVEPTETNPDPGGVKDNIEKLLKEIKECVCKPDVDLDLLFLPVVDAAQSCDIQTLSLLVPKGSVSPSSERVIEETAQLARKACKEKEVKQLPEEQIFAATVVIGGAEIFTGEIKPEVVSLRVRIDGFDEELLSKITLYPDSNQRKFGSVAFVTNSVQGGGDYIYVFDSDTYVPLPKRGKNGKLRILFKPSVSFRVFDTGERL